MALKLSFLFLIILSTVNACAQHPPCKDTSFKKLYKINDGIIINHQYLTDKENNNLLSGVFQDPVSGDTGLSVIKLTPVGNKLWAKKFLFPAIHKFQYPADLVEFENGDIGLLLFFSGENSIGLLRLDNSGNLLWMKSLKGPDWEQIQYSRIFGFGNELYVTFLLTTGAAQTESSDKNSIIKLDQYGNVLWSKYYGKDYACRTSIPTALYRIADSLIVFGRMFPGGCDSYTGPTDKEQSYFGMKVSDDNGRLGRSYSYLSPKEFGETLWQWSSLNFASITRPTGNDLFLSATHFPRFTNKYGGYKIKFDTNLNIKEGTLYYHTDNSLPTLNNIKVGKDGATTIVFHATNPAGNAIQYFAKFSPENVCIRELKLEDQSNTLSYTKGINLIGEKMGYLNTFSNIIRGAENLIGLVQLNDELEESTCFGEKYDFIQADPYTMTPYSSPFFDGDFDMNLSSQDIVVLESDLDISEENQCSVISRCDSISIKGGDKICNISQEVLFTAQRNAACHKIIKWDIDTSEISYLRYLSDTTIAIKFRNDWQGYLHASTSCNIKDSIRIEVYQNAESLNLGSDTTICTGDTLSLEASKYFKSFEWQDGTISSEHPVSEDGTYTLKVEDYCGNIFSDTINISVNHPQKIFPLSDTTICSNEMLQLRAPDEFVKHVWNTGDTSRRIIVNKAGTYIVYGINNFGCEAHDTIHVQVYQIPGLSLNKNQKFCEGQNNEINIGSGFDSYLWQNGITDSIIKIVEPRWYKIIASKGKCEASDSVFVSKIFSPPSGFLGNDISICKNEIITLSPKGIFNEYLWNNGSDGIYLEINIPGNYWLRVKDANNCTGLDSIIVFEKDCKNYFFVPNSFTPNGDGLNDFFRPAVTGIIEKYEFSVYNNFGQRIFYSRKQDSGWDGKFKGRLQNSGVYSWTCTYKFIHEEPRQKKGTVSLIR